MNPVFVKIEKYKKAGTVIERVKKRLDDAKTVLRRLNEIRSQEERELHEWQQELAAIEKKIEYIEDALSKPEER